MQQYALIGFPLGHSLSPQIHERLFALSGAQADYRLLTVSPEELPSRMPELRELSGFNVTIPHKQAVIPFLDGLSERARLYDAVNTVRAENGRLIGHNTDCDGFLYTMRSHKIALDTDVCVLGAGGVGRMFAIECARRGASVTVAARTQSLDKARALSVEMLGKTGRSARIADLAEIPGQFGLVINATPVGMYPHTEESPVPDAFLERTEAVFDCIYNPAETALLRAARALGKPCAGGMDMLVWQAAAAQQIWLGVQFAESDIQRVIAEMNGYLPHWEGAK